MSRGTLRRALPIAAASLGLATVSPVALGLDLIGFEPAPTAVSPPALTVTARFDAAPANPDTVSTATFTVREVLPGGQFGPPLESEQVMSSPDATEFTLVLADLLGSGGTWQVRLRDVPVPEPQILLSWAWNFATESDGNPPDALPQLTASASTSSVSLTWTAPLDFDRASVRLLRRTGEGAPVEGDPQTVVVGSFPGDQTQATDTDVTPGQAYAYAAVPVDRDGNRGGAAFAPPVTVPTPPAPPPAAPPPAPAPTPPPPATIQTTSGTRLIAPARRTGLRARRPIAVSWQPNAAASYYNVQIFRGRQKLLSLFPASPRLVVAGRYLRRAGRYRVVVWSGIGPKSLAHYDDQPWLDVVLRVTLSRPSKRRR